MECLTPTVSFDLSMDNYFTFFRLFVCLPTLELTPSGKNSCKKGNVITLNSAADIKQQCCVACVADKNDKRALYIVSYESCQSNRNLLGVGVNQNMSFV